MTVKLNKDQAFAVKDMKEWWRSQYNFYILRGRAGCGKTYLVDHFLDIIKPKVLLLAPTHQAKKQLELSTKGKYVVKTVDSALGIRPTTHKEDLKFEQVGNFSLFDNFELVGVDEAGMLDDWRIEMLTSIGIKMFFLGHESQLPPIKENKSNDDLCVSPIFEKSYPSCKLTIPERNTGHGFDFCNKLEALIYEEGDQEIPADFDVSREFLYNYVNSEEGKNDFLSNKTKIVCWTNHHVELISYRVRKSIFGDVINKVPFIMGDKLITSAPINIIPDFLKKNDKQVFNLMNSKDLEVLYTNEGLEVKYFSEEVVKLNQDLHVPVYKIACSWEEKFVFIYVLVNPSDYQHIKDYYFRRSWNFQGKDKIRKLQEMHFILSCFSQVKFFYAATAHRLQGSTWDKVIVFNQDISKNPCIVERKKMRYVAASRHKNELMFFRGNV